MELRAAEPADLVALAAMIAAAQRDPARHVGEFGMDADGIAQQLAELEPGGLAGCRLAVDAGSIVGVLAAEWDDAPPRVWWYGPVALDDVDQDPVADALYASLRATLPASVVQEELAPDRRNRGLASFAERHGFHAEEASVVLHRRLGAAAEDATAPARADLRPFEEGDRDAVATLHEQLFPGTHTPGHRLDEGRDRVLLVAEAEGRLVGYVAVERQEDGEGYVDFLGVAPGSRGRGLGRELVTAGIGVLRERFGCPGVSLTVRVSNAAARRVYERCGFEEERELVPWRKGFSLS